jgi:hypothetical protein
MAGCKRSVIISDLNFIEVRYRLMAYSYLNDISKSSRIYELVFSLLCDLLIGAEKRRCTRGRLQMSTSNTFSSAFT